MVQSVLNHADDPWWDEVILLAAAHPNLSDRRREFLLRKMLGAGHLILAGRCAVDAGARLPAPLHQQLRDKLYAHMTGVGQSPKERYAASEVLDELGWLPDDPSTGSGQGLNAWVRCPGTAEDGSDLLVMKYPVTNAQFDRFIQAGGYENSAYWGGEVGEAWQWRVKGERRWSSAGTDEPEYWHNPRLGKERRGYPVVGVSWYEATAYAAWLTDVLRRARAGDETLPAEDRALVADLLEADSSEVCLPTEKQWERAAGGVADKDRYPWDPMQGPARQDEAAILARANTDESGIGGTSPVAMYPLGASQPFGLMDLAGNVWEWTATAEGAVRVLRGGSWGNYQGIARCASRLRSNPYDSDYSLGFRLVSPV